MTLTGLLSNQPFGKVFSKSGSGIKWEGLRRISWSTKVKIKAIMELVKTSKRTLQKSVSAKDRRELTSFTSKMLSSLNTIGHFKKRFLELGSPYVNLCPHPNNSSVA